MGYLLQKSKFLEGIASYGSMSKSVHRKLQDENDSLILKIDQLKSILTRVRGVDYRYLKKEDVPQVLNDSQMK